ncbi:MAG: ubiquitin-like domain-containing protein [Propionibacteriaceae bacterium]|nr:ubiquitin-like domain-containing protein [Propionibacteriaceae bacterium]
MSKLAWLAAGGLAAGLVLTGLGLERVVTGQVTLVVDDQTTTVPVLVASVAEVLAGQGVVLGPRDEVSPAVATRARPGLVIRVAHARPVDLRLDDFEGVYWTTATTVAALTAELGWEAEPEIQISCPGDQAIPLEGLAVSISQGKDVVVSADGREQALRARGTVADALAAAGLRWDDDDLVTPGLTERLNHGTAVSLVRVEARTVDRLVELPFAVVHQEAPDLELGRSEIVQPGSAGLKRETVVEIYHDGQLVSSTVTAEQILTPVVDQLERRGAKLPASATPGSAQALAHQQVLDRGWDGQQFLCLVELWTRESGWRVDASNPSSGAYGIPQALPGSKMAQIGDDWRTNPATQITWGLNYISNRYGSPCQAWSFFQARGWY